MPLPISNRKALHEWPLYLFVLPSLVLVLLFAYFPALSAVYHSFFMWHGGNAKQFVGLRNFEALVRDATLWTSFATVGVLVVANIFKLIPSIALAVLVHRLKSSRSQYLYRVILVLPMIVPGLVTLFIWKSFFDPNFGLVNRLLDLTHLKAVLVWLDADVFHWGVFRAAVPIGWLSQPQLILPALILWGFPWIGAVGVLIYLAGLQAIGTEVYEAAELDGASSWQLFTNIELPLITTQVRLTLVLLVIGTLQGFGLQFLLLGPNGGPAARGMTPGLWMYNRAFIAGDFGYACAVGMVLFAVILVLTVVNNKFVRVQK
jgi:raffinose/stachyose/melibiose transport system permease protein